jgi:3'-phosphoadenosine 5'-phosphosulfate sulfotransferase (PAPS reductase)/FAD synthetase
VNEQLQLPAQYVAFSGGKDSTAMAYRMAEMKEAFALLYTPTGNELPELDAHIRRVVADLGVPLATPRNHDLEFWIREYEALPNNRQRWCTRQLKVEVCAAYLSLRPGSTLCVGLRADEMERKGAAYSGITYRCPMQEWGWKLADVTDYLAAKGITVPRRTDCAWCYDQRLGEWWRLWKNHPDVWRRGESLEAEISLARGERRSFRSPSRDTWPAPLIDLRRRFEAGERPRGSDDADAETTRCRECTL